MYACGFENKKLWFGSLKAFCFLKYGRALHSTLIGTRWTNILLSVAVKTLDHWQSSEENPKSKNVETGSKRVKDHALGFRNSREELQDPN